MEANVVGFCVKVDGHVSYLACPYCYAHLCQSYQQFNVIGIDETDSGSSSSEIEHLDDALVYERLKSIVGAPYRQVSIQRNMWMSCSTLRELQDVRIRGRKFGRVVDFKRLADELFWDAPSGLVVVNLDKEKAVVFKAGQEPSSIAVSSALTYLRRWAGMGLAVFEKDKICFLECHWQTGSVRTTIRRLMRVTVESWIR